MYMYMYMYMYVCMYVCVYIYIHTYIHTYIYKYVHVYACEGGEASAARCCRGCEARVRARVHEPLSKAYHHQRQYLHFCTRKASNLSASTSVH